MVISPYRTQLTAMIQNGEKNPARNMTNRKALEKPARRDAWLRRKPA